VNFEAKLAHAVKENFKNIVGMAHLKQGRV